MDLFILKLRFLRNFRVLVTIEPSSSLLTVRYHELLDNFQVSVTLIAISQSENYDVILCL